MRSAPSVTVGPESNPLTVRVDLAALLRLEEDMQQSIVEIAETFRAAGASDDAAKPKPLKLAFMAGFVASLLDIPQDRLEVELGLEGLLPAFGALSAVFVEAVMQLHEKRAEGKGGSRGTTAPGPGLSLGSAPTSSDDSPPPIFEN